MEKLSDRINRLSTSATLAMSQKSGELKAQGIDIINMSVGEPDFNTPAHIKAAAIKAVEDNWSRYSPVAGYPALREAIRSRNAIYNKQISLVEEFEEQGKLIVLRPECPIVVDRMERNTQKLIDLYDEGYECASKIEFII